MCSENNRTSHLSYSQKGTGRQETRTIPRVGNAWGQEPGESQDKRGHQRLSCEVSQPSFTNVPPCKETPQVNNLCGSVQGKLSDLIAVKSKCSSGKSPLLIIGAQIKTPQETVGTTSELTLIIGKAKDKSHDSHAKGNQDVEASFLGTQL